MANTSVDILITINAEELHKDPNNPLKYVEFSDNVPGDKYDDPRDKSTFDSIADSQQWVTWDIQDNSGKGHLAIINKIEFSNLPEGFFEKAPYDPGDGSFVAVVGDNKTDHNLIAEYTITFDSGYRDGNSTFSIDPKLQIRKKDIGTN